MTAPDFDAMRARTDAATPPTGGTRWHYERFSHGWLVATGADAFHIGEDGRYDAEDFGIFTREEDAAFVAHASEDMTVLLDWFDGVRAVIEREHPVELWTDYSNAEHGPIEDRTGCPTCRTDGPCNTRQEAGL